MQHNAKIKIQISHYCIKTCINRNNILLLFKILLKKPVICPLFYQSGLGNNNSEASDTVMHTIGGTVTEHYTLFYPTDPLLNQDIEAIEQKLQMEEKICTTSSVSEMPTLKLHGYQALHFCSKLFSISP